MTCSFVALSFSAMQSYGKFVPLSVGEFMNLNRSPQGFFVERGYN